MALVLNVLLHILLAGSLACFLIAIIAVTLRTDNRIERAIRAAALLCGAMVVLGAQAAGIGLAEFMVQSITESRPAPGIGITSALLPGVAGITMGWYFTRALKRSENIAVRVLGFFGMLATVQFAQIYAVAAETRGFLLGAASVPNISFIVGVIAFIVLKYDPDQAQEQAHRPSAAAMLGNALATKNGKFSGLAAALAGTAEEAVVPTAQASGPASASIGDQETVPAGNTHTIAERSDRRDY